MKSSGTMGEVRDKPTGYDADDRDMGVIHMWLTIITPVGYRTAVMNNDMASGSSQTLIP